MIKIDNLGSEALQNVRISLDDLSVVELTMRFLPATQKWSYDLVYGEFISKGNILCTHANILRRFRKNLPFGLACLTSDGTEPFMIDDFVTGRVSLYILNADDVDYVEESIIGAAA